MAIVYKAMMYYGAYESAPEIYDQGEKGYKDFLSRMMSDRMPQLRLAGALA
jgi:hypothetical protein